MQAQLIVTGLLNIVRILAGVALLLVCLMIINTVTTVLSEQIRIIGTMKALGGTRWQIMRSYLLSVGIYGISGTVLGMVGADPYVPMLPLSRPRRPRLISGRFRSRQG